MVTPPKGWGKSFDTAMLIYRHLAIMVYSEKWGDIIALRKCEDHYTKKLRSLHYIIHETVLLSTQNICSN